MLRSLTRGARLLTLLPCLLFFVQLAAQMPDLSNKYKALELRADFQTKTLIKELRVEGQRKNWTFQVGPTSVARYIRNDIRAITGAQLPRLAAAPPSANSLSGPPPAGLTTGINARASRMDLRTLGFVSTVRDQGGCGSCWAFCSTASIETAHVIRNRVNRNSIDLAEQYALSCSGAGSCGGGQPQKVFDHFKSNGKGQPVDGSQRYTASNASCPSAPRFSEYKVDNWGWVGSNRGAATVAEMKNAIARYGAVESYVYVNSSFGAYTNGVINDDSRTGWGGWHCVQVVGWDDAKQAYLIKNSWGTGWGMNGFGWVRYNVLGMGNWAAWVTAKPIVRTNLNGYYSCNDGGHYYVRQVGNKVYWFGEQPGGGWANVFYGTLSGSTVNGEFFDVPAGRYQGGGNLRLTVSNGGRNIAKVSGAFGGTRWTKTGTPARLPGYRAAGFNANGNINNLSGLWQCNDGGKYYVRQKGNSIAWFGMGNVNGSGKAGFANVGVGTRSGNTFRMNWADVPKCNMKGNGRLSLRVDGANKFVKTSGSGFGGSSWTRAGGGGGNSFSGNWKNKDAKTRGVTRFALGKGAATVRLYGSCSPKDCDWGVTRLTKSGTSYKATYDQGFGKKYVTLTPSGKNVKMVVKATYKDSRPDRTSTYYFTKYGK